jgi:predicted RND superfamily exporter protein
LASTGTGPGSPAALESLLAWLSGRGRFPFLALLLLATAGFSVAALRLGPEAETASMVSRDEAQRASYDAFRSAFGSDEEVVLSVTHPRLFGPEGLRYLDALTREIERLPGVRRVYSLTNARRAVNGPAGAESEPLVREPYDAPGLARRVLAALEENPKLAGLLVSGDRRTAGITVETDVRSTGEEAGTGITEAIRGVMARRAAEAELHLSGISVQKHDVAEFVRRDKAILIPLSMAVLAVLLAAAFRSVPGVLIPMAVKVVALAWTMGAYALAGFRLNPITALLPPLVVILSISTSIHLYDAWLRIPEGEGDGAPTMIRETRRLFAPSLYTALTTAFGLLSLVVSDIPAVRQFGVFGAFGVFVSFGASITLVPVAVTFFRGSGSRRKILRTGPPGRTLSGAARISTGRYRTVLAVALVVSAASAAGIARVRNNTDLVRFLSPGAPLYRDTLFIDRNLAGVYALEFMVSRADGRPMTDPQDMRALAAFQGMAAAQGSVAETYSIADVIGMIHAAETGGKPPLLPETADDLLYGFDLLSADREQPFLEKLMKGDRTVARVSVRVHAIGTSEAAPLVRTLLAGGKGILGDRYVLVPTGSFYQVTQDSNRLVRRQVASIALSLAAIALAIHVLFRSPAATLAALVSALVPALLAAGAMGYAGIDLSTGTAMVAPVILGLVVDNTIHYIARYRREYRGDVREAVGRTTVGAGRALAASSLILAFGFGVGGFGSFRPTVHFSLLAGGTMLAALACVLLVLPACLVLADRAGKGVRG